VWPQQGVRWSQGLAGAKGIGAKNGRAEGEAELSQADALGAGKTREPAHPLLRHTSGAWLSASRRPARIRSETLADVAVSRVDRLHAEPPMILHVKATIFSPCRAAARRRCRVHLVGK